MSLIVAETIYQRILKQFPQPLAFAFAYGSGVFKQTGYLKQDAMIDLVLAVNNPLHWHEANIQINPSHYSSMRYLGHTAIASYQEKLGAKCYFNTLIPFEDKIIKYGVISRSALITDLLDWETLYICGRMHKPVLYLQMLNSPQLENAIKHNLESAVHAALLMLPANFTEMEFYTVLAGISYIGDFRMWVGENKNKVPNIVTSQFDKFRELYIPIIEGMTNWIDISTEKKEGEQDISPTARLQHLDLLAKNLQGSIVKEFNRDGKSRDMEEVLLSLAHDIEIGDVVESAIGKIVWQTSISQSIKAIPAAGMWKSIRYSSNKILKMIKGGKKMEYS